MPTRHPNEPGADDGIPSIASAPAPPTQERREYDPKKRPIWTHGADGKPNRKIWIERGDWDAKIKADHEAIFGPMIERAQRIHAARVRIVKRFDRASLAGLERFATILECLTDAQLDEVAGFAEALGENPFGEVE